jgi:poly(A) polymerase
MLKRIRALLGRGDKPQAAEAPSVLDAQAAPAPVARVDPPPVHHGPRVVHQPIDRTELDPDAVKIIERLTRFEHGAYLVGGCVRDLLLERKPKDFDVGTSATPRQIRRVFRNCRIIGRRFRLAHIYFQNGKIIEVATFRAQDGDEPQGGSDPGSDLLIRDDNQFGTMEQDALRRDFTINSLFYDVDRGTVLDHADGLGDLRRRLVRTIGDPTVRFKEDPIRILRAIKFAARLDFEIEAATLRALRATCGELPKAATPRILEEINRFCRGGAARRSFELLRENGVLGIIAPEIADRVEHDEQRYRLLGALLADFDRRTAAGAEIHGGQVVAALVLAAAIDPRAWSEPPAARSAAESLPEVEDVLRPLAQRLRLPRRDQEHCRAVAATLRRMAALASTQRNTKRLLSRRSGLADALVILEALAEVHGGAFVEAAAFWRDATARGDGTGASSRPAASHETRAARDIETGGGAEGAEDEETGEAGRRRRRRRRGGRGRGGRRSGSPTATPPPPAQISTPAAAPRTGPSPRRAEQPRRPPGPPVWDDDYFFAALPSVPASEAGDLEGDRYGSAQNVLRDDPEPADAAGTVDAQAETEPLGDDQGPDDRAPADGTARPRRRRRRRRGGSRRGGGSAPPTTD